MSEDNLLIYKLIVAKKGTVRAKNQNYVKVYIVINREEEQIVAVGNEHKKKEVLINLMVQRTRRKMHNSSSLYYDHYKVDQSQPDLQLIMVDFEFMVLMICRRHIWGVLISLYNGVIKMNFID